MGWTSSHRRGMVRGSRLKRSFSLFRDSPTERGPIDYQAAARLMAVNPRGPSDRETRELTLSMARSGDTLDLSETVPFVLDKHSTGGVGDMVSLVASCELPVGKMTGRALGFTGGPSTSWNLFPASGLT